MSTTVRFALALLLLSTQAISQVTEKGFVLIGQLEGADSLKKAVLTRLDSRQVDTVAINQGRFTFSGNVPRPTVALIGTDKVRAGLGVWLTNDTIRATFNVVSYSERFRLLQPLSVSGPSESVDYLANMNALNYYNKLDLTKEKRNQLKADFIYEYVSKHPNSAYAAFFLRMNADYIAPDVTKELLASLSPALQQSEEGESIRKSIARNEATTLGKTVGNLTLPDHTGQLQTVNTTSKPFTLLYFWASWCGPCRKHNPDLVRLYRQVDPGRLQLISVSLDTDKSAWLKAIRQDGLQWTQLSDLKGWESPVAKQFALFGIPQTILLDQSGRIIAVDASEASRLLTTR
ncbi:alkyl hydroperoxide reductase/thiol specific antioxidant/Mal allergen [Fibrella aestuarina BUZ 2]|uniref:Alkyl hydroperoxide reductase/thiol specific antioxidant/Mal allergen n=1 Tax=Fibrella aestuarina BUZ 2 TaxID=1166018 RepID=I0KBP8_9BACT|nr:TlpA disulfide reductase family protein [Fibrella aestuarina]CCH01551.1 alkyl hydroperoxide reductase/thiol specific antioxidant/Mal allergen [Fibrella aestuarina BUZ 2]